METELAWAAGIYEASGSVSRQEGRQPRLSVKGTEEWVVRRFHEAVGLGTVYGPYNHQYKDGYRRRPYFVWIGDAEVAHAVGAMLEPYLSSNAAKKMRAILDDKTTPRPRPRGSI